MTAGIDCNYGPAVIDRRYSESNCTTTCLTSGFGMCEEAALTAPSNQALLGVSAGIG